MSKAERLSSVELDEYVLRGFAATFVSRPDMYALQRSNGRYVSVKKPFSDDLTTAHFTGHITLGTYALDQDNQAKWICLDADDEESWRAVRRMSTTLSDQNAPSYLELSRRGGHLWLFFPPRQPLSGVDARRFGQQLVTGYLLGGIELFPKQDVLTTGPGSLVRLPLGIHRKTGRRYHFIHPDGSPLAPTIRDQIALLAHPQCVQRVFIDTVLERTSTPAVPYPVPHLRPTGKGEGETLSARLKDRITVYEFVTQFVKLDEHGHGFCPFHNDQHQSFSVNRDQNYWHCFAGCGGGSIIDFWCKWREKHGQDTSFVATIKELADMLF